jgi:hypothetical protein
VGNDVGADDVRRLVAQVAAAERNLVAAQAKRTGAGNEPEVIVEGKVRVS